MKHSPYYKWILLVFVGFCLFTLGAILTPDISFLHKEPTDITSTRVTHPTSTIIVVNSSSSYLDPTSVIVLLSVMVAAITLGFVIKYVKYTAAMAKSTRDSADATHASAKAAKNTLEEMRRARDEENAPFVVVYFHYIHERYQSLYLVVENIGKNIARDIKFEFSPSLEVSKFNKETLQNNMLLKDGIKSLVPNYKILIPFDYLKHYLMENLPTEYMVRVSYCGRGVLAEQFLEYPLDLNHFKYIHFMSETGLGEINQTLQGLVDGIGSSYSAQIDTTNNALGQIASSIRNGIFVKNNVSVHLQNEDTATILKEFVLLWVVNYGKQTEKWNSSFISNLRAKSFLISDKLLKNSISDLPEWTESLNQITSKISTLAGMRLNVDLTDGTFPSFPAFMMSGSLQEDFNKLGDDIVANIRILIELTEKKEEVGLASNHKPDPDSPTFVEGDN